MDTPEINDDFVAFVLKSCVEYGQNMLALQLPAMEARNFDFMPELKKMVIHQFLVGLMWRFGEQFDLPTNARDRAFVCLMSILINEGMSLKDAQKYIANLNSGSRASDGEDSLPIAIGYSAGDKEEALVKVFEAYLKNPAARGAPWRLLDRAKPVAAILAVAALAIAKLLGTGWGQALGIGVVIGGSTLAIAVALHHQMKKQSTSQREIPKSNNR